MGFGDPLSELLGVGDGGGQEGKAGSLGGQHNGLLPYHSTLCVSQVVDLVKHQELGLQAGNAELL